MNGMLMVLWFLQIDGLINNFLQDRKVRIQIASLKHTFVIIAFNQVTKIFIILKFLFLQFKSKAAVYILGDITGKILNHKIT